jgi:hypothetical protein
MKGSETPAFSHALQVASAFIKISEFYIRVRSNRQQVENGNPEHGVGPK